MNSFNVLLQLGWLTELLAAVLTMVSEVDPGDVLLSVLLQVAAVATLVNNVEVLGQSPGLDHLHTKLTPSLTILDDCRRGRGAASLERLDGLRDVSLGRLACLH